MIGYRPELSLDFKIMFKTGEGKMLRIILAGLASLALASTATAAPRAAARAAPTKAVQCKDTKGKFIKCPAAVATSVAKSPVAVVLKKTTATKAVSAAPAKRCRDAKGRFAKCGTPGAK